MPTGSKAAASISADEHEQLTPWRGLLIFAPLLLLLVGALLFGGASRANPIGLMIVEGLGVLSLVPAVLRSPDLSFSRQAQAAMILLALAVGLPLLQLTPLPPDIFKMIPGRQALAGVVTLAGLPDHWRPMTLAPEETQGAALFLLAPAGMFLAALQCGLRERLWLILAVLCVAVVSLPVGLVQAVTGSAGSIPAYPGAIPGLPIGFFANRNHEAAFMVSAIGLSAAVAGGTPLPFVMERRLLVIVALMLVFAAAAAATVSPAILILLGPVLAAAFLIVQPRLPGLKPWVRLGIPLAIVGVAVLILLLTWGAEGQHFSLTDMGAYSGVDVASNVVKAGRALQPLGGGLGTFDLAYRSVEPLDQVMPAYLNHAHNDFVELWLETGWPGVTLMLMALIWLGYGAWTAWREPARPDAALARSGGLVAICLLVQSAVDYPLRTPAMAVVFALACALMAPTPESRRPD